MGDDAGHANSAEPLESVPTLASFCLIRHRIGMGKYTPLSEYLAERPDALHEITLSFEEVEQLVGPLPPSARKHRPWWANDSKSEAVAWRNAGWHVAAVNLSSEMVTFRRGRIGGSYRAKRGAETRAAKFTVPPTPPAAAIAQKASAEAEAMTEAQVQASVVAHLVSQGWSILRVAETRYREQGIDVLAAKGDNMLAVEVKGQPSRQYADPRRAHETKPTHPATQSRHWYAQALLKCLLTRDEHPHYEIAVALPDVVTYRNLYSRTRKSLQALAIRIMLVSPDSVVEM